MGVYRGRRKRRWYEKNPLVHQSVSLLELLPKDVMSVVAQGICALAEKQFKADELVRSFRSLGTEKVLSLYKSKNKRRILDGDPVMHKAINYLFVLSNNQQQALCQQIVEMTQCIYDYFKACQLKQTQPNLDAIESLTRTYVGQGLAEAKVLLRHLEENLHQQDSDHHEEG